MPKVTSFSTHDIVTLICVNSSLNYPILSYPCETVTSFLSFRVVWVNHFAGCRAMMKTFAAVAVAGIVGKFVLSVYHLLDFGRELTFNDQNCCLFLSDEPPARTLPWASMGCCL